MAFQAQEGALTERFAATGYVATAGFDLIAYTATRSHLQELTEEGDKRGIQIQMDMGTSEGIGGGLRGFNGVVAAKESLEKQKKRRERELANQRLQALLDQLAGVDADIEKLQKQIDELDHKIDVLGEVMQGLSDGTISVDEALSRPEVAEAIREWERRNPGKKFDKDAENAANVLAEILAVQSGAYAEQKSALEQQLDAAVEKRDAIIGKIGEIDKDLALSLSEKRAKASEISSEGFTEAFTVAEATATEEIAQDAETHQDNHRESALDTTEDAMESNEELDSMFGEDSALEFASSDFGPQFANATQPPSAEEKPETTVENAPKPETGLS